MKDLSEKKYLKTTEAAKYLGVNPMTIRNWDRKGILVPDARIGNLRHRLYSKTLLDSFVENGKKDSVVTKKPKMVSNLVRGFIKSLESQRKSLSKLISKYEKSIYSQKDSDQNPS